MRYLVVAFALAACSQNPATPSNVRNFGAKLTERAATPLDQVLSNPDAFSGKEVLTSGVVRKACERKGCWMEVATSEAADAPGCRVTFKDYGFFVPKNSAGYTTRLEGTVEVRSLEKEHVEHYESEGARFTAKAADGTAREVRIVATGVEMTKAAAAVN
jgi:hypothetical protein